MFYPPIVVVALVSVLLALPQGGVFVPGKSLGGVRLGATEAQVRTLWGPRAGVCRSCADHTLYFTYGRFERAGAGVEFRRGRAVAVFTLWRPDGWRTDRGVRLGDPTVSLSGVYGTLPRVECGHYHARILRRGASVSAFYVKGDAVWAFGLLSRSARVCR